MLRKRLPEDLGGYRVLCSPEAMLSMWWPGWKRGGQAEGLFRWARTYVRPGMAVWDVGANQGLFSLAACSRVGASGSVLAFEPDPYLGSLVSMSFAGLPPGGPPTRLLSVALSDTHGVSPFRIASTDRALNHLVGMGGNPHAGGSRGDIPVVTVTGDWIAGRMGPPSLVKIDVEGAELAVLSGLRETLKEARPILIVETSKENSKPVESLLRNLRYRLHDAATGTPLPAGAVAWNTLAMPEEFAHP